MSYKKTILNKTTNFNDFLHKNNIPDNQCNDLIKKYKKLLENKNILKSENFHENFDLFLKDIDNTEINEDRENLKKIYDEQLKINDLYNNNKSEFDSIIFLSKLNDKEFSNFKIKSCFKHKILNFRKCIDHLKETERMWIIRYGEFEDFKKKYKIYYDDDDEQHFNEPKKDVLYRKVNNNYYVTNNDYFEKCTDFYFKLYSNIFSIFNLKRITLEFHNNETKMNDTSAGINGGIVNANGKYSKERRRNRKNNIKMRFNKNIDNKDNHNDFNRCVDEDEEIKFIKDRVPENLKKSLYNPKCILSLVKNRTKNTLKQFHQIQSIENTDIEKIESSIETRFNLTTKLGLFANSVNSTYINKRVVFILDFYDMNNDEQEESDDSEEDLSEDELTSDSSDYTSRQPKSKPRQRNLNKTVSHDYRTYRNDETPLKSYARSISPVLKADSKYESKYEDNEISEEDITLTVAKNEEEKILKWKYVQRGNDIPFNKIQGGITKADGVVYVGKINKSPGKVNTEKGKVWNYWVQNQGSSTSGFMLLTNYKYNWQKISCGDFIPINAIYCGKDEFNDCVWVGKSNDDEPGKITCIKNNDPQPKMQNLWCHSLWTGSKNAYILVVEKDDCKQYEEIEEEK
uniref:Uncharacterized protein n=1 Tax=viral metagenome TaxID=1070528 RepID=A0A6C0AYC6_9ZZZZ|tara:strand:+ start:4531 stop:6414 length:1884 start_codon:yes stop_codon:yes gene_type:complete